MRGIKYSEKIIAKWKVLSRAGSIRKTTEFTFWVIVTENAIEAFDFSKSGSGGFISKLFAIGIENDTKIRTHLLFDESKAGLLRQRGLECNSEED